MSTLLFGARTNASVRIVKQARPDSGTLSAVAETHTFPTSSSVTKTMLKSMSPSEYSSMNTCALAGPGSATRCPEYSVSATRT